MPECLLPADTPAPAIPVDAVERDRVSALREAAALAERGWLEATGFAGAAGEVALVPGEGGGLGRVVLGLGQGDAVPFAAGRLPSALPAGTYALGRGFADVGLASLAWALGAYRFGRYRKSESSDRRLILPGGVDEADIVRIADAVILARDLINMPANDLGPAELAAAAADLARRHGAVFSELVGEALIADGFPMIHAVGAAAAKGREPRLVDLVWGDQAHPKVTIVGKGVCFDTGGLDIKPSSGMILMKKDMGGAANALALAHMIMDAGLKIRLRVLIPAVENVISGAAFRPGDILQSRKGIAVEIGNTDAEGRLVLADALTLAGEDDPELIVDLATLTGAARVALGPEVMPFYTGDDTLAADLARHSEAVADPVWRMPLWRPYRAMLDSKVADISNAGAGSFAGSITAALFLERFVPDVSRWLHADIYGWNPKTTPGRPEGGEAQVVRALYALLADRYPG